MGWFRRSVSILSWALYDLANQFFALNVISLYFVRWLTLEKNAPEIFYSLAFGISMLFVAFLAPILGIVSDMRGRHKPFLVYFTAVAIIFTMLLGLVDNVFLALLLFAMANFGCQEAVVFYNALMVKISPKNKIGLVSGLGRMFGYSGALLALHLTKPIVLAAGYQATFLLAGILFLIFSLPCMVLIKEEPVKEKVNLIYFFRRRELLGIFNRLKITFFESHKYKGFLDFLKAAFFGLCAVNVIILFMSVYATKVFGLTESEIINLIISATFFAIGGSIFSGIISDYIGYKKSLMGVFFLWAVSLSGGALLGKTFYWLIGALVGISLGSIWVISRALAVKLVPEENIGEVFGLFNLVGYLSGVIGPLFWGLILLYLAPLGEVGYRIACLSLVLFMVIGFIFLSRIPKESGNRL